ncbi:hypothetical protein [Rhodococcoides kroppenstedtii]|uniref:hypothetical protein n=1 Tax=Rhodococcoides kroppenstedtii TaxID=293050 RepID=UPI001427D97A|nr:hypothetical protein [Rhodococcus kroppenstedtii]NIL80829.1 hypothetical protein [Rhodococcus kroppenstedtii]
MIDTPRPAVRRALGLAFFMTVGLFVWASVAFYDRTVEKVTLAVVYGRGSGLDPADVPAWTTLVGAPALRGHDVDVE